MGDLISREAAIEAVGDVHPLDYNGQAILERIKKLPSAQPDVEVASKNLSERLFRTKKVKDAVANVIDDPSHPFADGVMMKE